MNKILSIIVALICSLTGYAQSFDNAPKDKTAILMVHFGTTYDDTRSQTIDAINEKVKSEFPEINVFEAYTSRIIIEKLKKRGINKSTPVQALLRLAADGYTHVIVQGTNIIDGIETEVLRKEAAEMAPFFKEIRVGRPLLYSLEDCRKVVDIMKDRYGHSISKNGAVVLIGHGTSTPANAMYSQIDYMFTDENAPQFHVSTVEGYPDFDSTLARLKSAKVKTIHGDRKSVV